MLSSMTVTHTESTRCSKRFQRGRYEQSTALFKEVRPEPAERTARLRACQQAPVGKGRPATGIGQEDERERSDGELGHDEKRAGSVNGPLFVFYNIFILYVHTVGAFPFPPE